MSNKTPTKKQSPEDWHPADVVAALRKKGWSLRRLSVAQGYSPTLLKHANAHPYPWAERIIADAIGVKPQEIWPSRYDAEGRPNRTAGGTRRYRTKSISSERNDNVNRADED
ncbi:MAG: helix-turn-helix domain-containing protein [Methylotetracoccus sp.]